MNQQNQPQQTEEVDLGQLFDAIGRMFKRLFEFIGSIFQGLFLAFVWFVFFLKKNILILAAVLLIGLVVGFITNKSRDAVFQSKALIKQNYKTGENLYSTLDYYNELIAEKDSVSLSESLGLTPEEAGKIVGFQVSTDFDDNDKFMLYDEYISEIDTSLVSLKDYENYVENLEDYEFELQEIEIKFTERGLFDKTLVQIINSIESIDYFKREQQRDLQELNRRQEIIKESLEQSDSLQKVYQRVLQLTPELRENQTTITIEDENERTSSTKEFELYLNDVNLRRELVRLEREEDDLSKIIEVISTSKNNGTKYKKSELFGIALPNSIYYAVLYILVVMVVLLIMEFMRYLERYKHKI